MDGNSKNKRIEKIFQANLPKNQAIGDIFGSDKIELNPESEDVVKNITDLSKKNIFHENIAILNIYSLNIVVPSLGQSDSLQSGKRSC